MLTTIKSVVNEQLFLGKDNKLNLERPLTFPASVGPNPKQRPTPPPIVYLPPPEKPIKETTPVQKSVYIPPHKRVTSKTGGKRNRKTLRRRKVCRNVH